MPDDFYSAEGMLHIEGVKYMSGGMSNIWYVGLLVLAGEVK